MKYIYGATAIVNVVAAVICIIIFSLGFAFEIKGQWFYLIGLLLCVINFLAAIEAWDKQD